MRSHTSRHTKLGYFYLLDHLDDLLDDLGEGFGLIDYGAF